jgi:hypothetical protein
MSIAVHVWAILLLLAPVACAMAQSMEPRAYANVPVGLNFLVVGYGYSQGDVGADSSPLQDAEARVHTLPLGYVRSLDVLGRSGTIALLLPLAHLTATGSLGGATDARREVSGLADPLLRLAVNFHGAPALSAAEFAAYRQDLIVGASLYVTAPFGQYDADRLVNIGTNRWSVKPELGVSKVLGLWTVELAAGATWFSRNDEFFNGNTRSQDPLYSTQLHLTRQLGRGVWGALSTTYYEGGSTAINGVPRDDSLAGSRLGLTLSLPVDRWNSVKLTANGGLYARTGSDFVGVGVIWQHLWLGGP